MTLHNGVACIAYGSESVSEESPLSSLAYKIFDVNTSHVICTVHTAVTAVAHYQC